MTGEGINVEAYNPANSDRTNADLSRGSIAIEPGSIAAAIDSHSATDDAHKPYSQGDFVTGEPGGDDFCNVGQLTVAEQDKLPYVPPVPPSPDAGPDAQPTPAVPQQSFKYEWSNVRVYVKPSSLGTQLVGDLTYTTDTVADPDAGTNAHCSVTYRVSALYPQVACTSFCDCWPTADPTHGRATGSGINPDLFAPQPSADALCDVSDTAAAALEKQSKVTCDTVAGLCVLKGEPPN
jgi:hypothetical protein